MIGRCRHQTVPKIVARTSTRRLDRETRQRPDGIRLRCQSKRIAPNSSTLRSIPAPPTRRNTRHRQRSARPVQMSRSTPACRQPHHPSGARSEERTTTPAPRWVGQIRGEQRGHFRVLQPPRVTFLPMLAGRIAMIRICSVALRAVEDPAAGLGHGHDPSVDGQVAVRHRQVSGRVQAAAVPAAGLALRAGLWTLGAPSGHCCRA